MGWVLMSERELNRVEVLAQVDDGRLSVDNAANMLDLTRRQIFRLNRPGFGGEFFVQNLGDVIKSIYARVEGFLHFLRRPIANSAM
jgi:hypothetical protein